jgi:hypothetical protein
MYCEFRCLVIQQKRQQCCRKKMIVLKIKSLALGFTFFSSCQKLRLPTVERTFMATSRLKDIYQNKNFAGKVEISISSLSGRDISLLSLFTSRGEDEVIFPPGSRFCVKKVARKFFGLSQKTEVVLEEVPAEMPTSTKCN